MVLWNLAPTRQREVSGGYRSLSNTLVRAAADLGLESAYHHFGGHNHGEEPEPTFTRSQADEHGWHLDFCFAPRQWLEGAAIVIGSRDPWRGRSDHLPLFVELPDRHFDGGATHDNG
jgi:endonuclease/exonuclease/phosphatase family metal-dependent hydrolase